MESQLLDISVDIKKGRANDLPKQVIGNIKNSKKIKIKQQTIYNSADQEIGNILHSDEIDIEQYISKANADNDIEQVILNLLEDEYYSKVITDMGSLAVFENDITNL